MQVSFMLKHSNLTYSSTITPGINVRIKKQGKQEESCLLKTPKTDQPRENITSSQWRNFSKFICFLLLQIVCWEGCFTWPFCCFSERIFLKDVSECYLNLLLPNIQNVYCWPSCRTVPRHREYTAECLKESWLTARSGHNPRPTCHFLKKSL